MWQRLRDRRFALFQTGQIGRKNAKLIKSIDVWVPWMAETGPWVKLFNVLAKQASGLRVIELGWGIQNDFGWELVRGAKERGLGDNLQFARALGQIRGLEKLAIEGYYAKRWPAYLEKRMGLQVQAKPGHFRELKQGDLTKEELEVEQFKRELNEKELQSFRKSQDGTEDLIPDTRIEG